MIGQAARALTLVHGAGIVHRDIKPDNIMLVRDPDAGIGAGGGGLPYTVKLVDFGSARFLQLPGEPAMDVDAPTQRPGALTARPLTQEGSLCGTPNFMSPEMLLGDADVDAALDLWALAASTFQAFTGRIAFEGDAVGEVVESVCMRLPPVPSEIRHDLPASFDAWFARACHPDPELRFHGTVEFIAALEAALQSVLAPSPGRSAQSPLVTAPLPVSPVVAPFMVDTPVDPPVEQPRELPAQTQGMAPGAHPGSDLVLTLPNVAAPPRMLARAAFRSLTPAPSHRKVPSPFLTLCLCVVFGLVALAGWMR